MDWSFWASGRGAIGDQRFGADPRIAAAHGGSDNSPRAWSRSSCMPTIFADLLDRIGWAHRPGGGRIMGGCIALAFAIRHPGACVLALGLVRHQRAWYGPDAPKNWEAARECGARIGPVFVDRFSGHALVRGPVSVPSISASGQGHKRRPRFLRNDVAAYAQTCRMLGRLRTLRAGLASITAPTRDRGGQRKTMPRPLRWAEGHAQGPLREIHPHGAAGCAAYSPHWSGPARSLPSLKALLGRVCSP